MNKFNYCYLIINKIDGKCYIGSHSSMKNNDSYYGSGRLIKEEIKKTNKKQFVKIILKYYDDIFDARKNETKYIEMFQTLYPFGYNISPTGGFDFKNVGLHSDETKKILSEKRLGVEPWNKGKTGIMIHSDDSKIQMSINRKGEKNYMYGKKGILSPNYGIKRNKKTKSLLSDSKKGINNPRCGIYEIISPDNIYYYVDYSAAEFCRKYKHLNINKNFIYKVSKMINNTYKGWIIKKLN